MISFFKFNALSVPIFVFYQGLYRRIIKRYFYFIQFAIVHGKRICCLRYFNFNLLRFKSFHVIFSLCNKLWNFSSIVMKKNLLEEILFRQSDSIIRHYPILQFYYAYKNQDITIHLEL